MTSAPPELRTHEQVRSWAASGAMALCGGAGTGPLGPPEGMVPALASIGEHLAEHAAALGGRLDVDPLAILGERAAIAGLRPGGQISCGGGTRLVATMDGWVAVTLARPDDVDAVPAWLELPGAPDDPWAAVAETVRDRRAADLEVRAALLGMPVAALPDALAAPRSSTPLDAVGRTPVTAPAPAPLPLASLRVVDLSALWAGPLCGSLLASAGADVVKVESTERPDGARRGPARFFDLLNAGKRSVALDLRSREGVAALRRLVAGADVVIESSRPRALEQLGVVAADVIARGQPRVWASITGHGRSGPGRDRVAFGDDAAVAGGLVCWAGRTPSFCADAVADPVAGLVAAAAVLEALASGGVWLLDIPLAGVAATLAGPTLPVPPDVMQPAPPRARPAAGLGPRLGADTVDLLAEVGVR